MSTFPPGSWNLPCPNISKWAKHLSRAAPSDTLSTCCAHLVGFGQRLNLLLSALAGLTTLTNFGSVDNYFSPPSCTTMLQSMQPPPTNSTRSTVMGPLPVPTKWCDKPAAAEEVPQCSTKYEASWGKISGHKWSSSKWLPLYFVIVRVLCWSWYAVLFTTI